MGLPRTFLSDSQSRRGRHTRGRSSVLWDTEEYRLLRVDYYDREDAHVKSLRVIFDTHGNTDGTTNNTTLGRTRGRSSEYRLLRVDYYDREDAHVKSLRVDGYQQYEGGSGARTV